MEKSEPLIRVWLGGGGGGIGGGGGGGGFEDADLKGLRMRARTLRASLSAQAMCVWSQHIAFYQAHNRSVAYDVAVAAQDQKMCLVVLPAVVGRLFLVLLLGCFALLLSASESRPPFGSHQEPDPASIHTVHLVSSCHLDIGFVCTVGSRSKCTPSLLRPGGYLFGWEAAFEALGSLGEISGKLPKVLLCSVPSRSGWLI